jgi:thioesterase domain-containing protein
VTVSSLLAELRSRDIQVWVDGDQLRCNAPAGVLTPDLRDVLRQRKGDMIAFLRTAETVAHQQRAIVPLQPRGDRTPIFGVPGHNGDVFLYRALAQELGSDQPFFGLQPPGLEDDSEPLATVEELAAYFAAQIREFQPDGPYAVTGYCAGATIAFEVAQQLIRAGGRVDFVAFFAGAYPTWYRYTPQLRERVALRVKRLRKHLETLATLSMKERRAYIADKYRRYKNHVPEVDPVAVQRTTLKKITARAVRNYAPSNLPARVFQILPSKNCVLPEQATSSWRTIVPHMEEHCGPDGCEGDVMLLAPHVTAIAEVIRRCRDGN